MTTLRVPLFAIAIALLTLSCRDASSPEPQASSADAPVASADTATPEKPSQSLEPAISAARKGVGLAVTEGVDILELRIAFLLAVALDEPGTVSPLMEPLTEPPQDAPVELDNLAPTVHQEGLLQGLGVHATQAQRLEAALKRYTTLVEQGGWSPLVAEASEEVVRERLTLEGWLRKDESMAQGLERYQASHQLPTTGKLDAPTLKSLNVSAARRAAQIEVALEKHRAAGHHADERYVYVNVPDFHAELWSAGKLEMRFRVIVGTNKHRKKKRLLSATPLLSSLIDTVVVNPTWVVPTRIRNDSVRKNIAKDPAYLAKNGFVQRKTESGKAYLKQGPGPKNALGRFKFLFKNAHSVYLHDTPKKELFSEPVRAFSYGCVRVQDPQDFAAALLSVDRGEDPAKTLASFEPLLKAGIPKETHLKLKKPVAIHIEYITVHGDAEGTVSFLDDIYGYDRVAIESAEKRFMKAR